MKIEFRNWLEDKKRVSTHSYLNNGKLIIPNPDIEKELELVIKKYDELHKPAVIPQYVADWIIGHRDIFDLYPALKRLENNSLTWEQVYKWYRENTHKFVNAYLTGEYEVEEEPKYFVLSGDSEGFWFLSKNNDNEVVIVTNEDYYDRKWESLILTEQEIKDYDPRYMAFAEPVDKAEEE